MSEITVSFFGICTHVKLADGNHRVILPNANEARIGESRALARQRITPHVAQLQIFKKDVASIEDSLHDWFPLESGYPDEVWVWRLEGVALSIEGATAGGPSGEPSCIPHLTDYCCSLPPLHVGYETERGALDATHTACFFDFPDVTPAGRRVPRGDEGFHATAAMITVRAPESPVLTVRSGERKDGRISLREGARITVSSYPDEPTSAVDKNADFLLHFLSMTEVPAKSWFPPAPPWEQCLTVIDAVDLPRAKDRAEHGFTGPGCSNSAYP